MGTDSDPSREPRRGPPETGSVAGGFTVLDGVALVAGAAIASVHLRGVESSLAGPGWALMWLTFAGIAVTASGPFLGLARRFSGRPRAPARLGDRLWALLGAPWVLAAAPKALAGRAGPARGDAAGGLYEVAIVAGLGVACMVSLVVIWSRWVSVPPEEALRETPGGWTHALGLALAVAWPVQCGLGLAVLSGPS